MEAVEAFAALGSPRRWWKGGIAWKKGWMRMIQRLMDEIGVEATGEALRFDMS